MKASVKNGRAIAPKQDKPEKEPAKTPVNAVTSRTKQVNKVVLRDNVLKNVIHAELYKTFREKVKSEYDKVEKNYFSANGIAFSYNKVSACYYAAKEVAVILEKSTLKDTYLDIKRIDLNEHSVADLFGKSCPDEVLALIKEGKSFEGGHGLDLVRILTVLRKNGMRTGMTMIRFR